MSFPVEQVCRGLGREKNAKRYETGVQDCVDRHPAPVASGQGAGVAGMNDEWMTDSASPVLLEELMPAMLQGGEQNASLQRRGRSNQ